MDEADLDRRGRRALRRPRDRRARVVRPARAAIVHIDVDAAEIGKNVAAHIPVVGDARQALAGMLHEHLAGAGARPGAAARRGGSGSSRWRAEHPPREAEHPRRRDRRRGGARRPAGGDARAGDRDHRRRPAPDVGGEPAAVRPAAALADLRRPGHDGLRPAGGARGAGRVPGRAGRLRDRRRLAADEHRRSSRPPPRRSCR